MNVLIIASRFFMGGFSKSLINFLLCADKYPELDITVLTLQKNEIDDYQEIPARFNYIAFDGLEYEEKIKRGLSPQYFFNPQRIRNIEYVATELYSKAFHKPFPYKTMVKFMSYNELDRACRVTTDLSFCEDFDVAISWEEVFCNYLLANKIPVKRKIGYIHPNYLEVGFSRSADYNSLKKLDRIVTISLSCQETLCKVFPEFRGKTVYLPNRIHLDHLRKLSEAYDPKLESDCLNLVTSCRMSDHDKAIFRIVSLSRRLADNEIKFRWYLIGNGPDYNEFQSRIKEAQLENVIICLGQMDNPFPYMKAADLYVQQSYVEGRPVSVDEALLLNTPALITDYSSAHEQVEDGVTGWIVENNEEAIYKKMKSLLESPKTMNNARERLKKKDNTGFEDCSQFISLIKTICESN